MPWISKSSELSDKKFGLSGSALKIIAMLSMLVDHIGAGLYPDQMWWRVAGRIAFPIFAFLICEGYLHTRNIKRYALRLGLFAIISEIPFNLLHSDYIFDPGAQNIFFTLLIGLLTLYGYERFKDDPEDRQKAFNIKQLLVFIAGLLIAQVSRADYGAFGVALIYIFYLFRDRRGLALAFMAAANLAIGMLDFFYGFMPLQALAGLAALPLFFYNGEKGPSARYLFYAFYPAHITIIMVVKYFILNLPFNISNF